MKKIIALIFTINLMVMASFAQIVGNRVLAQGNPPLTQGMVDQLIDFFEFGLHGKFTGAEKAEFQRQRIAEWKNGDDESRKNAIGLIEMRTKLMALDDAQLKEAQARVENYLIEAFKKDPGEATSRMLLAVHERGSNNGGNISAAAGGSTNVGALLGSWGTGSVSGIGFYSAATNTTTNGGGTQVLYTFKPGGAYEYASQTTQNNYACHTEFSTFKTGIVSINGGVLTFIPRTSKFTSRDSCSARNNYEKPAGMERETYNWTIQRDEAGVKLCLQNAAVNGCAYKR